MNINLTLIGQSVAFAIFVWFCLKYIWPPILNALEERKTRIADGLAAAEKGHHEKELAERRAKELLVEAKEQAKDVIGHAQKRADGIVEEAKVEARAEGQRLIVAAKSEIDQQMNQAKEQLRKEVVAIALTGAEQVLMRQVDAKDHEQVLEKLVKQL